MFVCDVVSIWKVHVLMLVSQLQQSFLFEEIVIRPWRTYAVWIDAEPVETKIRRKHRCFQRPKGETSVDVVINFINELL